MSPDVVADAATNVDQEVIAADVVGAAEIAAGVIRAVEAGALPADTAHEVNSRLFTEAWLVDAIEIEQERPVRKSFAAIVALTASPHSVKSETHSSVENHVGADVGIQAAFFRTDEGDGRRRRTTRSSGRHEGPETEHGISLLGGTEAGETQNGRDGRKER